jgi:hypothetical protein
MGKGIESYKRAGPFSAGVLIGLSIVTPVFAATGDGFEDWQTALMIGSLILLILGVILKVRDNRAAKSTVRRESEPDMRRNRLTDTAVDHPLQFGVTPRRQFH